MITKLFLGYQESNDKRKKQESSEESTRLNQILVLMNQITTGLSNLTLHVSTLVSNSEMSSSQMRQDAAETAMEEKWKSVARKVDYHCMIMYICLMFFFHVLIAFVVIFNI